MIGNMTEGPDGRWTALDGRLLYKHGKTAGYLYQAALRAQLTERLGVRWTEVRRGTAEIGGIPRNVIGHFSQRRAEIVELMKRRGEHSARAAQIATLQTRRRKDHGVPVDRLRLGEIDHLQHGHPASVQIEADVEDIWGIIVTALVAIPPWWIGRLLRSRRKLVRALAEHNRDLEAAEQELARLSVRRERARVAHELHDFVGHQLAIVAVQAQAEALTNAMKHAPGAEVDVSLAVQDAELRVAVSDSGATGSSTLAGTGSGMGLPGMADHVGSLGGSLKSGPLESGGWRVLARLPLTAEGSQERSAATNPVS